MASTDREYGLLFLVSAMDWKWPMGKMESAHWKMLNFALLISSPGNNQGCACKTGVFY